MLGKDLLLKTIGYQDSHLTENPQFSFFKSEYKTHTNFCKFLMPIEPTKFNNNLISESNYKFGEIVNFIIDKSSDLLSGITLEVTVVGNDWTNNEKTVQETLFSIIDYIELKAGDKTLEKLTGDWMYIHHQLSHKNCQKIAIENMAYASERNITKTTSDDKKIHTLHLTIPFYFNNNFEKALPLWALQHEKIHLNVSLKQKQYFSKGSIDCFISKMILLGDFIELEEEEKNFFIDTPLEYVIEQIEFNDEHCIPINNRIHKKIQIDTYPYVKELIWVMKKDVINKENETNLNNHYDLNFSDSDTNHFNKIRLLLNGKALNYRNLKNMNSHLFRFQQYNGINNKDLYRSVSELNLNNIYKDFAPNSIYIYPFCLDTETINSTGYLDFNKFNSINLSLDIKKNTQYSRTLQIYIRKMNILRIKNGHINIISN